MIFFRIAKFANCEYLHSTMLKAPALKAQDVLVMCQLFAWGNKPWTYASLAEAVDLSVSEAHDAVKRCRAAQLLVTVRDGEIVSKKHFCDLLVFAAPRIFFAVRGNIALGWPTAYYLPALKGEFEGLRPEDHKAALPIVWPDIEGTVRGESLLPIYPSVPLAVRKDAALYEVLALVDVIRLGDARCRRKAVELLEKKIYGKPVE
jgi:hypothetical protein